MPVISKRKQRQAVWEKSGGQCWYCGGHLPKKGWHADHIDAVYRMADKGGMQNPENDNLANIVPACAPCNRFKSVFDIEGFRFEISKQVERARKYSVNFRTAERFDLIESKPTPVVFWFEKQGLSSDIAAS